MLGILGYLNRFWSLSWRLLPWPIDCHDYYHANDYDWQELQYHQSINANLCQFITSANVSAFESAAGTNCQLSYFLPPPMDPPSTPFQHLQPTALSCQKLPARIVQVRISNDKYTELPCKHLSYSSQKNILFKICTSSCNHCQTNLEQKINLGIFWGSKVWFNENCETFPAILESKQGCLGTWAHSDKWCELLLVALVKTSLQALQLLLSKKKTDPRSYWQG